MSKPQDRSSRNGRWQVDFVALDEARLPELQSQSLGWRKRQMIRCREGRYLLRSNLTTRDPADLWRFYIQLTEVEAAFKNLKDDMALRPIYHQTDTRIEAHIFVAFMAYCLHVTLRARLRKVASGLTPRAVLEKLAAIQMLDVHLPPSDAGTLLP